MSHPLLMEEPSFAATIFAVVGYFAHPKEGRQQYGQGYNT